MIRATTIYMHAEGAHFDHVYCGDVHLPLADI
jgi:hypothetical protein